MASVFTSYAEFQASEAYKSALAGAGIDVLLFDPANPTTRVVSAVTNLSLNETFEKVALLEAGNTGVNEFVDGAHTGSGSLSFHVRPENIDSLPTRDNAIGKRYAMFLMVASDGQREQQGAVLASIEGVVISQINRTTGARDAVTGSISFSYTKFLSGEQYAAASGS